LPWKKRVAQRSLLNASPVAVPQAPAPAVRAAPLKAKQQAKRALPARHLLWPRQLRSKLVSNIHGPEKPPPRRLFL
jgi:hypothetical protein